MKAVIKPSILRGTMKAPSSKSMSHRLLICAGLANGKSMITNIAYSQDVLATLDCLEAIGAKYEKHEDYVIIDGIDAGNMNIAGELPCRECGSTIRFFVPICLLADKEIKLTGSEKLLSRPMKVYEDMCSDKGLVFDNDGSRLLTKGPLTAGTYTIPGNVSSQFISGLLFALPLLEGDSEIVITDGLESASYIDLTIQALKDFGVIVEHDSGRHFSIKGNQRYIPQEISVEGDYSNAAFFEAANYIGGSVDITGLRDDSLQGDKIYEKLLPALTKEKAIMSLGNCPDLGPILFAMAGALNGAVFTNTERLRIKESDRISEVAEELIKFGIEVSDNRDNNSVTITAPEGGLNKPSETLSGHNDHRIVMALSVLSLVTGGEIDGIEAVNKSLPDFFDRIASLGADVTIME